MKHKPDASWNADSTERRGVRKSLTRAGVQLGYAVTGALTSSLEALEERLESGPASGGTAQDRMRELLSRDRAALHTRRGRPAAPAGPDEYGFAGKPSGGTARGRMRELLSQDRAMLATLDEEPFSELFEEAEQSGTMALPAAPRSAAPEAPPPAGPVARSAEPPSSGSAVSVMKAPVIVGSAGLQNGFVSGRAPAAGALPPAPAPAGHVAVAVFDPIATQPTAAAPRAPSPTTFAVFSPAPAPALEVSSAPAPVVAVAEAPSEVTTSARVQSAPVMAPAEAPKLSSPVANLAQAEPAPAPAKRAMPSLPNKVPVGSAPVAAPVEDGGDSPIRTRSMARLLALQGYRDKALSIYDDLIAAEPDNTDLRGEADRLRG